MKRFLPTFFFLPQGQYPSPYCSNFSLYFPLVLTVCKAYGVLAITSMLF